MRKMHIVSMVALVAITLSVTPVRAEETPFRARQAERQEKRQESITARCQLITDRMSTQIARHDNNRGLYQAWSQQVISWTEKVKEKATTAGLSTSELDADLATFKTKLAATEAAHQAYVTALKETQQQACGESDGAFKSELSQARALHLEMRTAIMDLRSFYQNELRPTLQSLRQQAAQEKK
jgi:hypothetical protein